MFGGSGIFFCALEVFDHERHVRIEFVDLLQECAVIQMAKSRADLIKMGGQFVVEENVFCMAAFDVRAKHFEAVANECSIVIISVRAVDDVDGVEMNGKMFAAYGLDETQIAFG